ncbi:hypothetical protein KQI68_06670 [Peptoniphilus sp. MSJ-1]|uniref:Uncharacterized protein n=1 Tax=Peptoniphilus ovalis TaxID=2841503 RepID=A0ABS6FHS2_9FIRM|nr:hypothetical protein [Peptoniphilus ovalis]MBU5669521.1 hypothetical protein [Peptoniphilus ovalis]
MNKKYKDLDQAIDELLKSTKAENLDEDLEDEELEEPTETVEDEVEKAEDDTDELEDEPTDETEEKIEDEPLEEEEEVEEEPVDEVEEDGYMELDEVVEEVTNRIMDNIKDYINEILENKEEDKEEETTVDELATTVEKSLDIIKLLNEKIDAEIADRKEDNIVKGLSAKVDNLDKLVKSRKSYSNNKNLEVIERFDEKRDVEDLSKSERVDILSRAFQAGNKDINLVDITNAELGRTLSNNAIRVLRNSIGK